MALSPRANATAGSPKEIVSLSVSQATVCPPSSLHPGPVRSSDLSCSVALNSSFGFPFQDFITQRVPPPHSHCMELPQPQLPFEGSKPPHDFLSLYGDSSSNRVEHRSSQANSTHLKTQDFLQPLERGSKNSNTKGLEVSSAETSAAAPASSVEHVLPGGIGTYTISHISGYSQMNGKSEIPVVHVNVAETKPEVTRAASSTNYGGGAFTLWEERLRVVDGNRTSDGPATSDFSKEYLEKSGYWPAIRAKADLSFPAKTAFSLSSVETSQQQLPSSSKQRLQTGPGFVEMIKSIKTISEDDEDEEDEYVDRSREGRKEGSSQKGDPPPKADGRSSDQKANTPRSKHSATEQRRRSKINDRFQMLRDLVPNSDQKRDKASFLLEVIEYIQVLQEKVRKYETTEQSWNQERMKTMVWDLCKKSPGHGEVPVDGSRIGVGIPSDSKQNNEVGDPARSKVTSNALRYENGTAGADMHPTSQNLLQPNKPTPVIPGCAPSYKEKENIGAFNKSIPPTLSMQQCVYSPFGRSYIHSANPKGQATSEIHSLQGIQGMTPMCIPANTYNFDKEKDVDTATPVQLSHFQGNTVTVAKTTSGHESQWSELRSSQVSPIQQYSGQNGGILLKDEAADTKSASKSENQHSSAYLNSSPRLSQYVPQSEAELASRQPQPPCSSSDQQRASEARPATSEQEELVIQGGVINVSSVYSQGLLHTLTQALQNSGLDLSQANISVQIDLGRRGGTSGTTTNIKEHSHNHEESSQNHQLHGQSRAAETSSECEQPPKRPKIERDV